MGLFDRFAKAVGFKEKVKEKAEAEKKETVGKHSENSAIETEKGHRTETRTSSEKLVLVPTSHVVEEEEYGDGDSVYRVSYRINDAFQSIKSHAAEGTMLSIYVPEGADVETCSLIPYVAVQMDDDVYCAVEEYKERGTFTGATELTPLNGKFYFKAKMESYGMMLYFYGLDRCEGFWVNNGLCVAYSTQDVGTEYEAKLMQVLDEVAASYQEEKIKG